MVPRLYPAYSVFKFAPIMTPLYFLKIVILLGIMLRNFLARRFLKDDKIATTSSCDLIFCFYIFHLFTFAGGRSFQIVGCGLHGRTIVGCEARELPELRNSVGWEYGGQKHEDNNKIRHLCKYISVRSLIPSFKIKRIQHGSKFKQHFGRGFFALPCVCTLYLNAF
jgi:hypothetical protein